MTGRDAMAAGRSDSATGAATAAANIARLFAPRSIAIVGMSSEPQYRDGFGPFPPGFRNVRYGDAAGDLSAGDLLLQNAAGVIIKVRAKREGLMLSLGADAMSIRLK